MPEKPQLPSKAFWDDLNDEAKYAFAQLMVTGYDDACSMLYDAEIKPPALDFMRADPEAMLSVNWATLKNYGAFIHTDLDSVWDGIYADLAFQRPEPELVYSGKYVTGHIDWGTGDVTLTGVFDTAPEADTPMEEWEEIEDPFPYLHEYDPNPSGMPRLMVMGHGRHGKDTVCEMLEEMYGIRFRSSSFACSEIVVCKILTDLDTRKSFLEYLPEDMRVRMVEAIATYNEGWSCMNQDLMPPSLSFEEWVYEVRSNYRELWFQAIRWYNWGDPTRLFREIMSEADVYCGIRDPRELNAIVNSGLLDDVIWVDASKRVPPEDESSIGVQPWHATLHLDNNHGLEELRTAIQQLMWGQYGLVPYAHLEE